MLFAFIKSMNDSTLDFMAYLKYYRPKVHDHFISMLFMGVRQGKSSFDYIWDMLSKPCKFPWDKRDINLWEIRYALQHDQWHSHTWERLMKQKGEKHDKPTISRNH